MKRICETELGIISQCCQGKLASKFNKQILTNIALKINAKVGGTNTVLNDAISRQIPLVSDSPTIIFGADVTHPAPGVDFGLSYAAVCCSLVYLIFHILICFYLQQDLIGARILVSFRNLHTLVCL